MMQRCPECGQRLKTNYCDICMRKVPFGGVKQPRHQDPWDMKADSSAHRTEKGHTCVEFGEDRKMPWGGSSAHRSEKDHTCVSFETKPKKSLPVSPAKKQAKDKKKTASLVAIILAVLSLLPTLFSIVEDVSSELPAPTPETVPVDSYSDGVPAIEPTEIYNDGAIVVTADYADLYYDDYTVFLTVVNESEEDIVVGTDLLSVNGMMHQANFYAEVDAGHSVQEALQLYSWELERAGVEEVVEIAFCLCIYDQFDYADIARTEVITLKTEAADTYEQPEFMDGWDLYTDGDLLLRLVSTSVYSGECELRFYMENLSENTLSVYASSVTANAEATDSYLWQPLRPGTGAIYDMYLYDLGINDLTELEEVTLDLLIEHMDGLEILDSSVGTITFNPNEL